MFDNNVQPNPTNIEVSTVSTVYSKMYSAAANCVTGAIHTYNFTLHGIEMRGTNK